MGGWSTKIHAAVDVLGNPLRLILTVGQRVDNTQVEDSIADYETGALLANRGYDADSLIDSLVLAGVEVVIPSKKNQLQERVIDKNLYQDRNKVDLTYLRQVISS